MVEEDLVLTELNKLEEQKKEILKLLEQKVKILEKIRQSKVILLFLNNQELNRAVVTDIYDYYKKYLKNPVNNLDIVVHSGGGDIDATFHLVSLFRKMAKKKLTFIVPRWAKSAATCLVTGGDFLILGESSELGPIDPQISMIKKGEVEYQFSPLSIKGTFKFFSDLLDDPSINKSLIQEMMNKVHPLSLGEHIRSMFVVPTYLENILKSRMFNGKNSEEIKKITKILSEGFSHHGYCILKDDAKKFGLHLEEVSTKDWDLIWSLWMSNNKIIQISNKIQEIKDKEKDIIEI